MAVEVTPFNDNCLDADTRAFLQEKEQSIRASLKKTVEEIIAIGLDLIEVKDRLDRGEFVSWIQSRFGMSLRSAEYFMQYADRFGGTKIAKIAPTSTVLKELLNSDESIIEMVEKGQIEPTIPAIREANKELQQSTQAYTPIPFVQLTSEQIQNFNEKWGNTVPEEPIQPITPIQTTWEPTVQPIWARGTVQEEEAKEQRDAHVMRVMGSSDSPEWYTPPEIVEKVLELMGRIDLDPCSNSHEDPKVPAVTRYTKDDDGLSREWKGKTYLNPPYGTVIGIWTNKLIESYKSGDVEEAVALLPGRIDTNWFNPLYEYLICIIKGRVQFENSPYHAPFPCVLVYLGERRDEFTKVFSSFGPIVKRIA